VTIGERGAASASIDGFSAPHTIFGLGGGYDYRIGKMVLGTYGYWDATFGSTDMSLSYNNESLATAKFDIANHWGIGGRLGVLTSENTLAYTGIAFTQMDTTTTATITTETGAKDITFNGWEIPVGMETYLSKNLSFKVEGVYSSYSKESLIDNHGVNVTLQPDVYSVKMGLNYRFGGASTSDILK
jgi:opacity protein-like surface antigen